MSAISVQLCSRDETAGIRYSLAAANCGIDVQVTLTCK